MWLRRQSGPRTHGFVDRVPEYSTGISQPPKGTMRPFEASGGVEWGLAQKWSDCVGGQHLTVLCAPRGDQPRRRIDLRTTGVAARSRARHGNSRRYGALLMNAGGTLGREAAAKQLDGSSRSRRSDPCRAIGDGRVGHLNSERSRLRRCAALAASGALCCEPMQEPGRKSTTSENSVVARRTTCAVWMPVSIRTRRSRKSLPCS